MRTIEKARAEIEQGRLWRAKEMLQGSLGNFGYNLELYEEYGKVLLLMGDLPSAGKFLFLSGVRKPEYEQAIGIYLTRHRGRPAQLFSTFPRTARLIVLSTYPKPVEEDLRRLGFPNNLSLFSGAFIRREAETEDEGSKLGVLGLIILILFVLVLLVLLGLGWMKLRELQRKYPIIGNNTYEFSSTI
jgi:hypothetical protein